MTERRTCNVKLGAVHAIMVKRAGERFTVDDLGVLLGWPTRVFDNAARLIWCCAVLLEREKIKRAQDCDLIEYWYEPPRENVWQPTPYSEPPIEHEEAGV